MTDRVSNADLSCKKEMFMKSKDETPRWAGPDTDIPRGLPGRKGCISAMKEDEAKCEKTLAGRENQTAIHRAAVARAVKAAKGGK
jgi:hypothetical protein